MTGQEFGKLEAAQRQINAAIRMFIHGEDPFAFHTLASASWKDLRDLSRYLPIPATDSGSSNNKAQLQSRSTVGLASRPIPALHRPSAAHRRHRHEDSMTIPYSDAVGEAICVRLIEGESLREICEDPDLPSQRTVYRWLAAEPTFWQLYIRAREAQMDRWSDEIVEIADDASNDYMERIGKDGETEYVANPELMQRSKLRIDTRKWLMSKLAAKQYGDKIDVNVSATVEVSALSDEELEARTRARLIDLGVEVAAPLLVALPGTAKVLVPRPEPEPVESVEVIEPGDGEPTPSSRSTRKKSTNDLLGLVV